MRLNDIISFRRDLLFHGAVEIGWLEDNVDLAERAAAHYCFHGPAYHGIDRALAEDQALRQVDTATFTLEVLERITGRRADEPFTLAVAGYGTGKSHLAVTLASLLRAPRSPLAGRILDNLSSADRRIGARVGQILNAVDRPFLVIAINGMRDFDLTGEIVRQVMLALREHGLDTSPLDDLRPRFRYAANFTEAFFDALRADYAAAFGDAGAEQVLERLQQQDEEAFGWVSAIHERKIGTALRAVGQESLHDLIRVTRETYCGAGRPFAGIVVLFDEFGRFLEFSVQRPQVAGPGALQQLFEAVQANGEGVFLLPFIQFELRAYVSRVAPELRDDLQRYVTRYDVVHKTRLSTNLETLIANLLEKRDRAALRTQVGERGEPSGALRTQMQMWFPEMAAHAIWNDGETFERVVQEGCWPLHPLATWLLYHLASVGRSLQQRSALSLLADAYAAVEERDVSPGLSIAPVDLCGDPLIDEFVAAEKSGQQGAAAQAYRSVLSKYGHQMTPLEVRVLRAVLLMAKTSPRTTSRDDCLRALAMFSGRAAEAVAPALHSLERERGCLSWDEGLCQYEIVSDAVPRTQFVAYLDNEVGRVSADNRASLFGVRYAEWFPDLATFPTDFGARSQIATKEWNYRVHFTGVKLLGSQIRLAVTYWLEARAVDEAKGQLIYCYVGPESDLNAVRAAATAQLRTRLESAGVRWETGAPIAIMLLPDEGGEFGAKIAEYWVLEQGMAARDVERYNAFLYGRKVSTKQDLENLFDALRRQRQMVFATAQDVRVSTLGATLDGLFDALYPQRITFPFDGYSTTRGNAAPDCALFTRELFLGHLDQDWISSRSSRERNRAVQVLSEAWQAFDRAGALRLLPGNPAVRRLIESLDARLTEPGAERPLVLGQAIRELCAPPVGCNLAAAGLLLGLFVGARMASVELLKGGRPISMENWLRVALSRNTLDLSVLDDTVVVQVSDVVRNEWSLLLNGWEIETTYFGILEYRKKAEELVKRVPVPQALLYQYDNLKRKASDALAQLSGHSRRLDDAAEKVQSGIEQDSFPVLSWGSALWADLRGSMSLEPDLWTQTQVAFVERQGAAARVQCQERFEKWLRRLRPPSLAKIASYIDTLRRVGGNLAKMSLVQEKELLDQCIEQLEQNARFMEQVHRLKPDVEQYIRQNSPGAATPISDINEWLQRVEGFREVLKDVQGRKAIMAQDYLDSIVAAIDEYVRVCNARIREQKERLMAVYNTAPDTIAAIHSLRGEAIALQQIFVGQGEDAADLELIVAQLASIESGYRQLANEGLSPDEFEQTLERCAAETETQFGRDAPPLDNEAIYDALAVGIRERREREADTWIRTQVPEPDAVAAASAERARDWRERLWSAPRYLREEQKELVRHSMAACDRRLEALQVDGLVALYEALPVASRKEFLARIGLAGA